MDAYVPDEYVDDSRQKVEIYKKVIRVKDLDGGGCPRQEAADRFGPVPEPVENLFQVARSRSWPDVGITSSPGRRTRSCSSLCRDWSCRGI